MWCSVNNRFELVDWNVQNTWGQYNHEPCTDLESTWLLKRTAVKKRNTGGWTYHAFIPSGWGSGVRNPRALNHDTCLYDGKSIQATALCFPLFLFRCTHELLLVSQNRKLALCSGIGNTDFAFGQNAIVAFCFCAFSLCHDCIAMICTECR